MKLFLVETNQFEYDTYDSAVIACESRAKLVHFYKKELR